MSKLEEERVEKLRKRKESKKASQKLKKEIKVSSEGEDFTVNDVFTEPTEEPGRDETNDSNTGTETTAENHTLENKETCT